jgi:hypothetical protein
MVALLTLLPGLRLYSHIADRLLCGSGTIARLIFADDVIGFFSQARILPANLRVFRRSQAQARPLLADAAR